jgi:hypothetical protein
MQWEMWSVGLLVLQDYDLIGRSLHDEIVGSREADPWFRSCQTNNSLRKQALGSIPEYQDLVLPFCFKQGKLPPKYHLKPWSYVMTK